MKSLRGEFNFENILQFFNLCTHQDRGQHLLKTRLKHYEHYVIEATLGKQDQHMSQTYTNVLIYKIVYLISLLGGYTRVRCNPQNIT